MRKAIILAALAIATTVAFAQTQDTAGFTMQAGISLGTDVITVNGVAQTYNSLGFKPDVALGPFGIGLDLTIRFRLMPDPDNPEKMVEIYPGDWVPADFNEFFDLYLPKIMYIRFGQRGEPLFVKLGSIEDLTLGNGFLVGNYSNTRFLPQLRIFGMELGLDGQLFNFPLVGIQALTGNLARLDVFGSRLFIRPLTWTSIPIFKNIQLGGTIAMDRTPGLYTGLDQEQIMIAGADIMLPIIQNQLFPLAAFMEMGFQPGDRSGFMLGVGGRLLGFLSYGAQLRLLGAGFIPVYFDANYDLYRSSKATFMQTTPVGDGFAGWLASLGTSLFDDMIFFNISVDGPFKPAPATRSDSQADYPHLRGVAGLAEGIIGGLSFDAVYEKYFLGANDKTFFADLIDPTDAVISAAINYRSGSAVFTLLYNLRWDPSKKDFDITSSLQTTIKF
jgi:hypothetical protein